MKLGLKNRAGLMEVSKIEADADGKKLIVTGTILGSVPIRAIVEPRELRSALKLMNIKTLIASAWIFLFR